MSIVFRLGGTDLYVPLTAGSFVCNGQTVGLNYPFSMTLTLDGAPGVNGGADSTIDVTYDNLIVGGYYLIGTGGDSSNWSQVHRAANELLTANEQYPIVNSVAGDPYVDANANGLIDVGESRLLDNYPAQDALTGGLLYTAMNLYFARFHDAISRIDALNHVTSPIEGFVGVVSSTYEVEYLDGTAFSVMPGGLLIDMKGQRFNGTWLNNSVSTFANDHFKLVGHAMSSMEHEIWQEITGFDAVSTVRGIQMALSNGASLVDARKNTTENTLPTFFSALGFTTMAPAPYVSNVRNIFSNQLASWSHPLNSQLLHLAKSTVDSSMTTTPPYRATRWTYSNTGSSPDAWAGCVDSQEEQLKSYVAQGFGASSASMTFCDGSAHSGTISGLLTQLSTFWSTTVIPTKIGQSYVDFFDVNQGFVAADYVYRDAVIPVDYHSTGLVWSIRDNLSLITGNFWKQYTIPSRLTVGDSYRFSVYIENTFDSTNNQLTGQAFKIQNLSISAGGGYVDGAVPLSPASDNTGITFNNELFTDKNVNAYVSNDLVRTPSTADPISTVNGNIYHDEIDIMIKGRGINYALTRTYNSEHVKSASSGTPFSKGWTHSYNMCLVANDYGQYPNYAAIQAPENANGTTSSITYVNERGGELNYLLDDVGATWAVTPPHGNFDTLALDTPVLGSYTLSFRNGIRYIFSGGDLKIPGNVAQLSRIEDPQGNQLLFTYTNGKLTKIEDNLGIAVRTGLSLTYTGGKLTTITDWTNRTWTYGYDVNGRLDTVSNPLNQTIKYTYQNSSDYLKDMILPEDRDSNGVGDVKTIFTYYRNGKAFTNTNSYGYGETVDYDLYRKRTRVTDPRGFTRTHYYNKDGALTKLSEPDGGILRFKNNQDGLRYAKINALGFETQYSYRTDRSLGANVSDTYGQVTLEQDALGNTIEYTYGSNDQITALKDKYGNLSSRTYYPLTNPAMRALKDKLHQVKATVNGVADVLLQEFQYYSNGNLKQKVEYIDPANLTRKRITDFIYDSDGFTLTDLYIKGSGKQIHTTYAYDTLGRRVSQTRYRNGTALTTSFEYDLLGRAIKVTNPLGDISETTYDANGNVLQETVHYLKPDATYVIRTIATHSYDAADRLTSTSDILGNTTSFSYDAGGKLLTTTDALNHTIRFKYNSMGRATDAIDANGYQVKTEYNLAGQIIKITDANLHVIRFEYDALGRQIKVTTPLGKVTQKAYNSNGNLTHITDANAIAGTQPKNVFNASVYREYDELGHLTRTVNAENGETLMSYDLFGNLTSLTDAKGQVTRYVYDDLGQLIETIDPLIEAGTDKTLTLTYDDQGNLKTSTDRKGQVTQYTYDTLNRLTKADYLADASSESISYDIYGNLTVLSNAHVTYSYVYDLKGRLISKTDSRNNKSLNWEYDAVGNIIKKTDYQNDVTFYQYDNGNRLVAERSAAYLQVSYHYDPTGRLLNRILSNGAKTNYKYDADGRLISLANFSANGTKVHSQNYGYDHVGNINAYKDDTGLITTNFTYDPMYRLLNADYPGTANDQSYTYDLVGNRLTQTKLSGPLFYWYSDGNRLLSVFQGSVGGVGLRLYYYVYDDNGNRTAKVDFHGMVIQSYSYNPKNRISSISTASDVHNFQYDPGGYRIEKQATAIGTRRYYLEAEHLEAVYDQNNILKEKYLRGAVVDELVNGYHYNSANPDDWINYTYHHDQLKSVTALSRHDGVSVQTTEYGPFGEQIAGTGSSSNAMQYTGRESDGELGLYYYRARYYDPEVGRFLTEDPMGFGAGINFFAYVGNNPVNGTDPSGLTDIFIGGAGDDDSKIVSNYRDNFQSNNPGRTTQYFEWNQQQQIVNYINNARPPINLVGHSYGGSTATTVVEKLGNQNPPVTVDLLITADPVSRFWSMPAELDNVTNWVNINAQPTKRDITDTIASVGGKWGEWPNGRADVYYSIDANHGGFSKLLNTSPLSGGESALQTLLGSTGASGGFVLYPGRPNTNMMLNIYRK